MKLDCEIAKPGSKEVFQSQPKNKYRCSLLQPYPAIDCKLRQAANSGQAVQSGDSDELIKHMSNLPGFLRQAEKEKTVQEKALNFGVLDWKRLEKWKYTERMPGRSPKKTPSASVPPKMCPSFKKHQSSQWQPPPLHRTDYKDVGLQNFRQKVELCQRSCSKTNVSSSKRKDPWKVNSLPEQNKHETAVNTDEVKFTTECSAEPQNNLPGHLNSYSQSSQLMQSRASYDGQFSDVAVNTLSDLFSAEHTPKPDKTATSTAIDLDLRTNASEGKCLMIRVETTRPSTEQPVVKGRAPSPTRRFKESSATPQLSSSVKSGQVKPEFSSEKESSNGRGQSSPLRRLLNPLLKYKATQSSVRTKPEAEVSRIQALLQLTMKNDLPFFKLVVDNAEDMLAAAVKTLPTTGKNDPCMIYTFYSVHEIRKKGINWISQGSKSKNCSLGYKITGRMKISSSAEDYDAYRARECVLYGIDPDVPNKEIAAVIVKSSINFPRFSSTGATVAILPGGVHSTPIKGMPSSLISRWRSGGQCDCGGWDVGCKLRILADRRRSSSVLQASVSSSDVDRVNLFLQGDELKSKPVFSLEPLSNGLYLVELDNSFSLLEAFATCVAHVTCSKFPEIVDTKCQSDAEHFPETPTKFQVQLSAKYTTCPPLSPAGRI
ncbi:uncharacterized protein LOC127251091 [Andrographis paniculata]|uniref:uncharacterized protein LOC127251091 n=1 Tax=Andrographis paniculata TaxID=175694 RepID=UPI0021E8F529|nr:uncharacterized protein LOC127251091 [Andrographis paniculata]